MVLASRANNITTRIALMFSWRTKICKATSEGYEITSRHIVSRHSWYSLRVIQKLTEGLALFLEMRPIWRFNNLSFHPLFRVACSGTRELKVSIIPGIVHVKKKQMAFLVSLKFAIP